ncbi:MAG: hypothetical protein HFG45_08400 [Oscillospiraceae bacterium]|nr:hypothetical protein [Oscillospiraceae bacterium]
MKKRFALLLAVMLLTISACIGTNDSTQTNIPNADDEVQYGYQLKAGEMTEVYDVIFEKWSPSQLTQPAHAMPLMSCGATSYSIIASLTVA